MARRPALALPALCLVTDRTLSGADRLPDVVAQAVAGGVTMVQLRENDLPTAELSALAQRLKPLLGGAALVVNGNADVARAVGAAGVQLGRHSPPTATVRRLVGPDMLIGRSVHSVAEAVAAEREGADFVVLGTIFPSRSHPGRPGAGLALVRAARAVVRLPIIAIGGIDAANARSVMEAGADGVAVISAIISAPDPRAAAAALARAVREGWRPSRNER
ncbi:MAG: thiamine phosphate synthase [Dehalococcoidales bacterium]|nr:thiamine phosphate synthase [Dehalococcoidales bacterium]